MLEGQLCRDSIADGTVEVVVGIGGYRDLAGLWLDRDSFEVAWLQPCCLVTVG